jgi:excisionase family DNA binding protein
MDMSLPKIYNVKDVANYLLVDEDTVTKLIRSRELAGKKVGREWRVTEDDLLEYLNTKKITRRRTA